jgi:hypothetical protein
MIVCQAAAENVQLKTSLFASLAANVRPDTILATNTSSISITKVAAAAIPSGETVASEAGKASAARVIGEYGLLAFSYIFMCCYRPPLLQSCARDGTRQPYLMCWNQ